ncbi:MAG: helix-turn-helix transcriptional regulator [Vicinamibacteria bacterium]
MQSADRWRAHPIAVQLELARLAAALSHQRCSWYPGSFPPFPACGRPDRARGGAGLSPRANALPGRLRIAAGNDDRWLSTDEAAELLKVDRKWLYPRARSFPFSRRLSRKKLLFSEVGLREWMATRKA